MRPPMTFLHRYHQISEYSVLEWCSITYTYMLSSCISFVFCKKKKISDTLKIKRSNSWKPLINALNAMGIQ